ncbi:MAG: glutamine-hydrolyzing GMP synthase [Waddliaceae bacterium]
MIVIIDFGSQTTHQIGRRLKEIGVHSVIIHPDKALDHAVDHRTKGVILSGGPSSVHQPHSPAIDPKIFQLPLPFLGICYGWQLMAHMLGGKVKKTTAEYGPQTLYFTHDHFQLKKTSTSAFMSHGDTVVSLPNDFAAFASTRQVPYSAVTDKNLRLWGVQFHPEVEHTEYGLEILTYFALTVCNCNKNQGQLDPDILIDSIKKTVGSNEVICAVSGGVDSTVSAALISKAIGKQLHLIYVDNGLMREGTLTRVQEIFKDADLTVINAKGQFLAALLGIEDPEIKRKTIGKLFIQLFEKEAQKFSSACYLAQGTIYSDVIESKRIKSHHNVGGLPQQMALTLLEPLRDYYKDQVREIGRLIGIQEKFLQQHPFPGPGYAVRIRGVITKKRLTQVKRADAILMEEIDKAGWIKRLFQCFAVMTGAFSTGVKGDERTFAEVVALRAFESTDVMTSKWAELPYSLMQTISNRIVNEVPDVSRVVYDITTKPPATMEWE